MYQASLAQKVLAKVDIVKIISEYIDLEKKGENYWATCPFHNEEEPSFSVSPRLGIFKCFSISCGESGNAASFISKYKGISYNQALAKLAISIGEPDWAEKFYTQSYSDIFMANNIALEYWQDVLFNKPLGSAGRKKLNERKIKVSTARVFGLGYAPDSWDYLLKQNIDISYLKQSNLVSKSAKSQNYFDFFRNRIIFPIYKEGNIVGFTGRILDDESKSAKYVNSKDSDWFHKQEVIFGWHQNQQVIKSTKHATIVEGQFDVIQLYQNDIKDAIAVSGSYFGPKQAHFLSHYIDKATVFADGDKAGKSAALRIAGTLVSYGIKVRIIFIKGKDPDELMRKYAPSQRKEIIKKSIYSLIEFSYQHEELETTISRIAGIPNTIKRALMIQELSNLSGIEEQKINHWIDKYKKSPLLPINIDLQNNSASILDHLTALSLSYDFELDDFIINHLDEKYDDLIIQQEPGALREWANNNLTIGLVSKLEKIEDKQKYYLDLINKLKIYYLQQDIDRDKELYRESGDAQFLVEIQQMVKQISKLKSHG